MGKVRLFALGGLDEDGKNMFVVENNKDIFIIECGMKFPGPDQLGIEMIVPEMQYIKENKSRVKGVIITHGHEDVIGGLVHLLKDVNVPVYMTPLTAMMFERMAKKEGLKDYSLHRIRRGSNFKIGTTEVRTFGVTESIADGFGLAIKTEDGYVVYSSEFVVDYDTKIDAFRFDMIDVMELGSKGILALLAESNGATREGHSSPNHRVTRIVEQRFEEAPGRILVTTYSRNLYRAVELIELANKFGRKVMIYDEELRQLLQDMASLGYYRMPAGLEIPPQNFTNDMEEVVVLIGGSGRTLFKKMNTIATREDPVIQLRPSDTVIVASAAVPGTEREESFMEDGIYKETSNVYVVSPKDVYSMHASIEDLKMMIFLLNPQYYLPVKGDYRQLISNANMALEMGYPASNIIVLDNGQVATIEGGLLERSYDHVVVDDVVVDGRENLDPSGMVLKDRVLLSTDGVIIVGVVVNHATKEIIGGPDVQSRGVIYLKDADYIIKEVGVMMEDTINEAVRTNTYDNTRCRVDARDKISRYIMRETGKRPMILPAIVEINTKD